MGKRLSPQAKMAVALRFLDLTKTGSLSGDFAARQIGQPLSSIYRWTKMFNDLNKQSRALASGDMTIDQAIATLVRSKTTGFERHEALFKFFAWMRWPGVPGDHPSVVTSCVTAHLAQASGKQTADQLAAPEQELLLRSLRLDDLAWMCTSDFRSRPEFEYVDGRDPNTGYYALGDALWFLIAYEGKGSKTRGAASLRKAAFLLEEDVFGTGAWSTSSFRDWWKGYGAAIPFWFVMREASNLDWGALQPKSKTFAADVDRVLSQQSALVDYFAKCRWVIELLRIRLEKRALERMDLPGFPIELEPVAFALRPISKAVEVALKYY